MLVVTVLINHYYCHSRITTTIARTGIDPSSLTSTVATASQISSVASAPASTTVPADATLIFRSPQELLLLPKRDCCFCSWNDSVPRSTQCCRSNIPPLLLLLQYLLTIAHLQCCFRSSIYYSACCCNQGLGHSCLGSWIIAVSRSIANLRCWNSSFQFLDRPNAITAPTETSDAGTVQFL